MANRRKKRNYFPNPRFQLRFLGVLLGGALAQISVTMAILFYFLRQNYSLLVHFGGLDEQITRLLYHELSFMMIVIGLTFAAYLLGLACLGIIFSHRIVGTIIAIKRTIREINRGKDGVLRFRKHDEWQDLADEFNTMVRNLKLQGPQKQNVV